MIENLMNYLYSKFEEENGVQLPKDEMIKKRIYEAAEKAIEELKKTDNTEINLPFIYATENGPLHLLISVNNDILNSDNKEFKKINAKKVNSNENNVLNNIPNVEFEIKNDNSKNLFKKKNFDEKENHKFPLKEVIIFFLFAIIIIILSIIWMNA